MRNFKGAGFIVFLLVNLIFTIGAEIVNQKVDQIIDISTQLVKKQIKITAKDDKNTPIKEYHFYLPAFEFDKVSFLVASVSSESEVPTIRDDKQKRYILQFKNAQPSQTFKVYMVLANSLKPHPEEIKQNDKQLVQYESYLYYYSAYKTVTQSTTMKLSTSTIISHTGLKPLSVLGNKIKYGPYDNIKAFDEQMLTVHSENQTPFMTVTDLEREIEVSHWGNIAVNEDINLYHSGAKLKGSFSRYEYQKDGRSGQSSVKYYKTILPSTATGVYYRDSNGNISTSNLKQLSDSVELELRPRFPLFGGWKTQYILGYNVPSFEYLYNKGDQYVLKMRIVDHIFDDMFIERATIKVILPEGASNIKLSTPYPVKRNENGMHFTYLDTVGRPVISFSKENLVENHISDFEISYTFSKTSLFQEPLLLIGFIYFIFILTIIFLRLDFSLSTTTHHSHKD